MLPDFPRTAFLPHKAKAKSGDRVSTAKEAKAIFDTDDLTIEEKVDGANTGMLLFEGHPIIRNRNHLLNKAFIQRKTAAKMQFASIHNWFYANMPKFEAVNDSVGFAASIYGEWLFAVHGIEYTALPELWVPYDIYDWEHHKFLPSTKARTVLADAGFFVPPLVHQGRVQSYEQLEAFCEEKSFWSDERREGVYIKVNDDDQMVARFKMVRADYIQGEKWNEDRITKNKVAK